MEIPPLFATTSSSEARLAKLKQILSSPYRNPSTDFLDYGFDYFDNSDIRSGYSHYCYDGRFKGAAKAIAEYYDLKPGSMIADFGCAKGYLLFEFLQLGFKVTGFEVSRYAIENAQQKVQSSIVEYSSISELKQHRLDLFVSRCVLPHLEIEEIREVIEASIEISKHHPYFVVHTFQREKDRGDYILWDRTHRTVLTADQWREFFEPYNGWLHFSLEILF
jgi:protein-L-isoaspartate(D-aspartate) O-methyltransferase